MEEKKVSSERLHERTRRLCIVHLTRKTIGMYVYVTCSGIEQGEMLSAYARKTYSVQDGLLFEKAHGKV